MAKIAAKIANAASTGRASVRNRAWSSPARPASDGRWLIFAFAAGRPRLDRRLGEGRVGMN